MTRSFGCNCKQASGHSTVGEAERDQEERERRHPQTRVERGKGSREKDKRSNDFENLRGDSIQLTSEYPCREDPKAYEESCH